MSRIYQYQLILSGRLGVFLERLGSGCVWRRLGRILGRLGASWIHLEAFLGASRSHKRIKIILELESL